MENDPRTMRRKDLEKEVLQLRDACRKNARLQEAMQAEIERLLAEGRAAREINPGTPILQTPELAAA